MATDNKDNKLSIGSSDYAEILRHAVAVIEHARTEIARHVNGYVSTAYWEIGQMLHERKIESGYGDSVVRRLSADLKERYPKMGVSPRQLWNMKKFYERYAGHDEKVLRSVALLPWSHNLLLLSKGFNDATTLQGKPIGVADYQLIVPKENYRKSLLMRLRHLVRRKKTKKHYNMDIQRINLHTSAFNEITHYIER